ncbi:MAG TPA: hypothetical protein GXZ60_03680 [Intrasporangiaceae bacterium]|nr:hypothetical protein [Intrasporangiaceae bacterium]
MSGLSVLGIPVTANQITRWTGYYAHVRRPFPVAGLPQVVVDAHADNEPGVVSDEVRDTFFLYGTGPLVWLSEDDVAGLERAVRSSLLNTQRRRLSPKPVPAWPSDPLVVPKLIRWIEAGVAPSLHALAQEELRAVTANCLPRALELAGDLPRRLGAELFRSGHDRRRGTGRA